jgi:hypothetical protein
MGAKSLHVTKRAAAGKSSTNGSPYEPIVDCSSPDPSLMPTSRGSSRRLARCLAVAIVTIDRGVGGAVQRAENGLYALIVPTSVIAIGAPMHSKSDDIGSGILAVPRSARCTILLSLIVRLYLSEPLTREARGEVNRVCNLATKFASTAGRVFPGRVADYCVDTR